MDRIDTGLKFDFTYAPGITQEQILAFEMAGAIWSSYLQDNLTVQIHVETTNLLPENVIGGALPGIQGNINYSNLRQKISEDIFSERDLLAFNNLSSEGNFYEVLVNENELDRGKKTKLTNANAKALNLLDGDNRQLDGYILMNNLTGMPDVTWNYDLLSNSNISETELDFLSVALHEIGHVLGFVSGVDDTDWLATVTRAEESNKKIRRNAIRFATPLDLFRYSSISAATSKIDFSIGGDSFFSLDGGQTNLGGFATGQYTDLGGDGLKASHWKEQGNSLGIMQPVLEAGIKQEISTLDLTAMDVIGWDLANPAELNWQQIYDAASDNAETSIVEDRSADVQSLIRSNEEYHGRIGRYSSSYNFAWQTGFWQFSTIEGLDATFEDNSVDSTPTTTTIEEVTTSTFLFTNSSSDVVKSQGKNKNDNHAVEVSHSDNPWLSPSSDRSQEIIADDGVSRDSLLLNDWIDRGAKLVANLEQLLVMPIY